MLWAQRATAQACTLFSGLLHLILHVGKHLTFKQQTTKALPSCQFPLECDPWNLQWNSRGKECGRIKPRQDNKQKGQQCTLMKYYHLIRSSLHTESIYLLHWTFLKGQNTWKWYVFSAKMSTVQKEHFNVEQSWNSVLTKFQYQTKKHTLFTITMQTVIWL